MELSSSHHFVYMARCSDGTLYTNTAENAEEAVVVINGGSGGSSLKQRLPVFLAYTEEYMNARDAEKRAASIRRMPAKAKELLVIDESYGLVAESQLVQKMTA